MIQILREAVKPKPDGIIPIARRAANLNISSLQELLELIEEKGFPVGQMPDGKLKVARGLNLNNHV